MAATGAPAQGPLAYARDLCAKVPDTIPSFP